MPGSTFAFVPTGNLVSTSRDYMFVEFGRKQAESRMIKGRTSLEEVSQKQTSFCSFVRLTASTVDILQPAEKMCRQTGKTWKLHVDRQQWEVNASPSVTENL